MAIIPVDQLPNEEKAPAKAKFIPVDQLPDDRSVGRKVMDSTKEIVGDIANRTLRDGMSFENITGGVGQVIAQNAKRAVLDRAIPTNNEAPKTFQDALNVDSNDVKIAGKEALTQATYGGNLLAVSPQVTQSNARPGALMKASSKAMREAETLATQILQPTTSELAESVAKGKRLPSIQRGAEAITRAKNFDELVGSLKTTTKELFEERKAIMTDYNKSVGNEMLDSLQEFTEATNKSRRFNKNQLKTIDEVAQREAQYLAENPSMDIIQAQARKEELQKHTRTLLDKKQAGTLTGRESLELQAYDALRAGYRKAILKALPKDKAAVVDKINSKYEGLTDATWLASVQGAKASKQVPHTFLEKVSNSFGLSPQFTAFRMITKEAAGLVGKTNLERTTSKIADLRAKSDLLKFLAKNASKVK